MHKQLNCHNIELKNRFSLKKSKVNCDLKKKKEKPILGCIRTMQTWNKL